MSMRRLDALLATSADITAVIRLGAGVLGSSAPNVNCGILESELDGVMPVERSAACAISGEQQDERNRECAQHPVHAEPRMDIQMPAAPTIGTPTQETGRGSSMCFQHVLAGRRRAAAREAAIRLDEHLGRAKSATIAATTIITMPHQSDQLFRMWARPNSAVPSAMEPARGWISPSEIMTGTHDQENLGRRRAADSLRCGFHEPARARSSRNRVSGDSASWRCPRRRASAAARAFVDERVVPASRLCAGARRLQAQPFSWMSFM